MSNSDPSDSSAQRAIESIMLCHVETNNPDWERVSWKDIATEFGLAKVWQKAEPDAVWRTGSDEIVIAESYARIGDLKPGHRRKIAMDAFKLLSIKQIIPLTIKVRCIIVIPEQLADEFKGESWLFEAIRSTAEIVSVRLKVHDIEVLDAATTLQAQGQARTVMPSSERSHV